MSIKKVVIFFDFDVVGDGSTYYFDDIFLEIHPHHKPKWWKNFEGTPPAFTDFGGAIAQVISNPDPSGANTTSNVAEFLKTSGPETWAGTFFDVGYALDLDTYSKISMMTLTPKAGVLVKFKLENSANDEEVYEVDLTTTLLNAWEEMIFDISNAPDFNFDRIVVFFDFGNVGDETTYYFDEIKQVSEGGGGSPLEGTWQVAYEVGSLGVGPNQGDISWWSIGEA
ncbi:MAG: hypothetical protein R2764_02055 [Bacteroidales bacterium]